MIREVGTLVQLSTVTRNLAGAAVNTPTLILTVQHPDGSTTTPSVTNTGANGIYTAQVTPDAAGTWPYRWTASGAVVDVQSDQFTVVASLRTMVASLEEFKVALRRTDTGDEGLLRDYLAAATDVAEDLIGGPLSVQTFTEYATCTGDHIAPLWRPLVSVTSLTADLATAALSAGQYVVDTTLGLIRFRYPWPARGLYTVVYRAGLATVSERVHRGGLMVATWLWQVENGGGGRPFDADTVTVAQYTIPRRAYQLLQGATPAGVA